MKTKTFFLSLLFSLVFITGIKAQVVTQVSLGSNVVSAIHSGGYIGVGIKDYNQDDASLKIFDENGNQLGPERNFPAYYGGGSPAAVTGYIAIKSENDLLVSGQVSATIEGTYGALRKYASGTNPVLEKIFYATPIMPFVFNGEYFAFVKTLSYSDFLNTGWNISYDGSQEDWHIVKLDNNLNIVWDYDIPYSFGEPHFFAPKLVQETPDGKMAIVLNDTGRNSHEFSKLIKIDPENGNFLGTIAEGNDPDDDVYIFEGGDLFFYKADVNILQRLLYPSPAQGSGVLAETRWLANGGNNYSMWGGTVPVYNLKIINGKVLTYGSSRKMGFLSENLQHNFRDWIPDPNPQPQGAPLSNKWFLDNGAIQYVYKDGNGNAFLYTYTPPQEDYTMIPTINQNFSSNILSVHYGKRLDENGNVVNGSPYDVVLGWADGTLPQVGDNVSGLYTMPNNPNASQMREDPFFTNFFGQIISKGVVLGMGDYHYDMYSLTVYSVLESSLGVDDDTTKNFSIYPNPVNDILHIKTDKKVDRVAIFDCNGRKVIEKNSEKNIDVGNLPTGMYFVRIFSEGKFVIKKLSVW